MRSGRMSIVIGIGLAGVLILCLMLCAGTLLVTFRKMDAALSPKVDTLFGAIDDGTFADTYSTQTTVEFRKTTTPQQYEQMGQTIKNRLGSLQSKKLSQFQLEKKDTSTFADVAYDAEFDKGSGKIEAKFEKVQGEWLLASLHVESPELDADKQE